MQNKLGYDCGLKVDEVLLSGRLHDEGIDPKTGEYSYREPFMTRRDGLPALGRRRPISEFRAADYRA